MSITYTLLNQYHVVMEVAPAFWQRPETLRDIYVPSSNGAMVPLSAFTRFERTATSLAVNHQGQFPAVTISFNLASGVSLGEAVKAVEAATRQMGLPASIRGSFQGTAQAFEASLANEPLLILAALLAVYIVLGILYESYIHPITILSTLPSAGVGAMLALLISRTELSVIAADRHHSPDRHSEEERHHDGRFCPGGGAQGGQEPRGGDLPGHVSCGSGRS